MLAFFSNNFILSLFSVTLFPLSTLVSYLVHFLIVCNVARFLCYCLHSCTLSHLLSFSFVILFHFKAHLVRASNTACFLSYSLHTCISSHLLCFLSVILFHSLDHFYRGCSIACFLFTGCSSFTSLKLAILFVVFLPLAFLYYFKLTRFPLSNLVSFNSALICS